MPPQSAIECLTVAPGQRPLLRRPLSLTPVAFAGILHNRQDPADHCRGGGEQLTRVQVKGTDDLLVVVKEGIGSGGKSDQRVRKIGMAAIGKSIARVFLNKTADFVADSLDHVSTRERLLPPPAGKSLPGFLLLQHLADLPGLPEGTCQAIVAAMRRIPGEGSHLGDIGIAFFAENGGIGLDIEDLADKLGMQAEF